MVKKFKLLFKNRKKGFTLVELLISMVLVGIFSVMLALISTVMMNNFKNNRDYMLANDIADNILLEMEDVLRKSNQIDFRNSIESLNGREELESSDFSFGIDENSHIISQLDKFSAIFSAKGMIYTIKKNPTNDYHTITNIEGIANRSQIVPDINAFGEIVEYSYRENIYLKGLFKLQEKIYFPEIPSNKNSNNDYGNFKTVVCFTPISTKVIGEENKYTFNSVKIIVDLYDKDEMLVTTGEKIITLKNIEKKLPGYSFTINGNVPSEDTPLDGQMRFRVLYYGLVYEL